MPALISPAAQATEKYREFLASYGVSSNGFVPEEAPLALLPDAIYAPWEALISDLPRLIKSRRIRQAVDDLPILCTDRLIHEEEWRRGYVIMAFLTQAYLWGGDEPSRTIPPPITVPFLAMCEHLDLPPVLTYAASNLWNFTCSPSSPITDPEALKIPASFTGTKSESWFLGISIAMEAAGAPVVPRMIQALNRVNENNYAEIASALYDLRDAIDATTALLERMYQHCIPDVFYNDIRPFLAGTVGMASVGLPNGVFYDEGNGKGEWRALRGGSNGQSSLIQFWDLVLGVNHKGEPLQTESPPEAELSTTTTTTTTSPPREQPTFHEQVREYMPGPHRAFLKYIRKQPSIRSLALAPRTCSEHEELYKAYQEAISALTAFRNSHIRIVTRYIVLPSRKAKTDGVKIDLASVSAGNEKTQELTGTGGTALLPFLKQSRDETSAAGIPDKQ